MRGPAGRRLPAVLAGRRREAPAERPNKAANAQWRAARHAVNPARRAARKREASVRGDFERGLKSSRRRTGFQIEESKEYE
jgi:hypothetical protein